MDEGFLLRLRHNVYIYAYAIRGAHLPPRVSSKLDSHMIFFGFNKAGETRVRVRSQVSPIHLSSCKTIAAD